MDVLVKTKPGTADKGIAIKRVGIIGAGQMGVGIAHVIATAGYTVALNDLEKARVDKGLEAIEKNMARQVAKGLLKDGEMHSALKRIGYAAGHKDLGDCDLVIEAATEDEGLKRKIFAELCQYL